MAGGALLVQLDDLLRGQRPPVKGHVVHKAVERLLRLGDREGPYGRGRIEGLELHVQDAVNEQAGGVALARDDEMIVHVVLKTPARAAETNALALRAVAVADLRGIAVNAEHVAGLGVGIAPIEDHPVGRTVREAGNRQFHPGRDGPISRQVEVRVGSKINIGTLLETQGVP